MGFFGELGSTLKTSIDGMRVTLKYFRRGVVGRSEIITTEYDATRSAVEEVQMFLPDRYRGHLHNDSDECITCNLCARACPIDCFVIEGEKVASEVLPISRKNRTQRPAVFEIDLGKCIYCGLCTIACPTDCLTMTRGFTGSTEKFWDRKPVKQDTAPGTWNRKDPTGTFHTCSGDGMIVHYGYGWMTVEQREAEDVKIAEREAERKRQAAEKARKKKEAQKANKPPPKAKPGGEKS